MIQVVWFKRDLRTVDHAPLAQAAAAGPVLPLYVVEPEYWRLPDVSARQWLAQRSALVEVAQRLARLGAPLIVRVGSVVEVLDRIRLSIGVARLLAHEETGNLWTYRRDTAVRDFCHRHRIPFLEFTQTGVIRGPRARDRWAAHFERFVAAPCVAEPARLAPIKRAQTVAVPTADQLGLGDDGCTAPQSGARETALALLESFLRGRGADYRRGMSSPLSGAQCCSRLSVPLATGAVSVREVMHRLHAARRIIGATPREDRAVPITALDSLIARLHWRSHFMQKLESEPELEVRSLHPVHQNARVDTARDDLALACWASGQTGVPFVDACMRSLIATGWLNFRMRAMVQSFASYHLELDWRASGERLARLFSDYEPGIHWPQVQMQSGHTGINVPRIYNPAKQGSDHDPEGVFTRRWVPETARIPLPVLQTPWLAREANRSGYPEPLVDIAVAARLARTRLTALRRSEGYQEAAIEVFKKHGSRKRRRENERLRTPPRAPIPRPDSSAQLALQLDGASGRRGSKGDG